jgi:hypothetical protein
MSADKKPQEDNRSNKKEKWNAPIHQPPPTEFLGLKQFISGGFPPLFNKIVIVEFKGISFHTFLFHSLNKF